jgi:type IV secretory pathway protease TraF
VVQWTEILVAAGVAMVVAIGIRIWRARAAARERGPVHIHEPLMKRAEALADQSPFLRKVTREFKANGHISNRQADAVKKAIERIEAR